MLAGGDCTIVEEVVDCWPGNGGKNDVLFQAVTLYNSRINDE